MRLSKEEQTDIKAVIRARDPEATVFLFGSRVDDNSRGGDIDLLILSDRIQERDRRMIKLALYDKLGEQKIDLVIARDLSKPFVRMVYNKGISL